MNDPIPWEKVVKALNRLGLSPETAITEALIEEALKQLDEIESDIKTIYEE